MGKPVTCTLTDTAYTDARQIIVIKLFPPQNVRTPQKVEVDYKTGSMKLYDGRSLQTVDSEITAIHEQYANTEAKGRYKLVVRCGSGWMSSREFFNKIHLSHLKSGLSTRATVNYLLLRRSKALRSEPSPKESVTIHPLFHPFSQLPFELQELILRTAAGWSRHYDLCSDDYGLTRGPKKKQVQAPISLSTMFQISKRMTQNMLPFMLHATDFHFGLTGFTNFLWQSGPANRAEVRRLTFHFGRLALLHCIRWMAPDEVFELFEPPVATNPRSLQYFWRCQIQELAKELNLLTLTIDIRMLPKEDALMVVAIMKLAFGSVEKLHFVDCGTERLQTGDEILEGLGGEQTWREMCLGYYQRHRTSSYYFKFEMLKGNQDDVEKTMNENRNFFDEEFTLAK